MQFFGFPNVSVLWGGFQHWTELKFPVELKKFRRPEHPGQAFGAVPRLELLAEPKEIVTYILDN